MSRRRAAARRSARIEEHGHIGGSWDSVGREERETARTPCRERDNGLQRGERAEARSDAGAEDSKRAAFPIQPAGRYDRDHTDIAWTLSFAPSPSTYKSNRILHASTTMEVSEPGAVGVSGVSALVAGASGSRDWRAVLSSTPGSAAAAVVIIDSSPSASSFCAASAAAAASASAAAAAFCAAISASLAFLDPGPPLFLLCPGIPLPRPRFGYLGSLTGAVGGPEAGVEEPSFVNRPLASPSEGVASGPGVSPEPATSGTMGLPFLSSCTGRGFSASQPAKPESLPPM